MPYLSPLPSAAPCDHFLAHGLASVDISSQKGQWCSICLENYSPGHRPVRINDVSGCRHIFGRVCITEWTKKGNTCPICRAKLFERHNSGSWWEDIPSLPTEIRSTSVQSLYQGHELPTEQYLDSPPGLSIRTRREMETPNERRRRQVRELNRRRIAEDLAYAQRQQAMQQKQQEMQQKQQEMQQKQQEMQQKQQEMQQIQHRVATLQGQLAWLRACQEEIRLINAEIRDQEATLRKNNDNDDADN